MPFPDEGRVVACIEQVMGEGGFARLNTTIFVFVLPQTLMPAEVGLVR